MKTGSSLAIAFFWIVVLSASLHAETGYAAWLRYEPIVDANVRRIYDRLPAAVVALDSSLVEQTAQKELVRGVRGMLGHTLRMDSKLPDEDCIVLGTIDSVKRVAPQIALPEQLAQDAYLLKVTAANGHRIFLVTAKNDRGVLY